MISESSKIKSLVFSHSTFSHWWELLRHYTHHNPICLTKKRVSLTGVREFPVRTWAHFMGFVMRFWISNLSTFLEIKMQVTWSIIEFKFFVWIVFVIIYSSALYRSMWHHNASNKMMHLSPLVMSLWYAGNVANNTGQQQNLNGNCSKCPSKYFWRWFKKCHYFFVAHLVFEISVCFGYQLPSLLQAYEQQKVALFCIMT